MNEVLTTIDLLRHGEPVGGQRFRGTIDDPLSELGWRQMEATAGALPAWQVVVSSPLRRCADFASALAGRHGVPLEREAGLREIGFGEWEGYTAKELMETSPEALTRFWSDPRGQTPPGGEPFADFAARVVAAWEGLLARHQGKQILLVCHGGVIRLILAHILEMPLGNLF